MITRPYSRCSMGPRNRAPFARNSPTGPVLRARLYEAERERQQAEEAAARRSQIGSGQRAEKIRTYNFPENRLTDHRVHLTVHRLDKILEGELDEFTEALAADDRRRALETASA